MAVSYEPGTPVLVVHEGLLITDYWETGPERPMIRDSLGHVVNTRRKGAKLGAEECKVGGERQRHRPVPFLVFFNILEPEL